jgi:hypothetical protein
VFNFEPVHSQDPLAEEQQNPIAMDSADPATNKNQMDQQGDSVKEVDSSLVTDNLHSEREISTEKQARETTNFSDTPEVIDFGSDLKSFFQDKQGGAADMAPPPVEPLINVPIADAEALFDRSGLENTEATEEEQEEDISLAENMAHDNKPELSPSIAEIMANLSTYTPANQTPDKPLAEDVESIENEITKAQPKRSIAGDF